MWRSCMYVNTIKCCGFTVSIDVLLLLKFCNFWLGGLVSVSQRCQFNQRVCAIQRFVGEVNCKLRSSDFVRLQHIVDHPIQAVQLPI